MALSKPLDLRMCNELESLHYIIKRVSEASKAFSLVMKTHNCRRLRVLTRHTCPHQAYVSSPGVHVLTRSKCPHLAYMSSPRIHAHVFQSTSPTPSWVCAQKLRTYHPVFKSIKSLEGDIVMDRCHYAAFQSHFK